MRNRPQAEEQPSRGHDRMMGNGWFGKPRERLVAEVLYAKLRRMGTVTALYVKHSVGRYGFGVEELPLKSA